jgi:hypothetical protein
LWRPYHIKMLSFSRSFLNPKTMLRPVMMHDAACLVKCT